MKIVREYIEFERTHDPYHDLDLGQRSKIEKWLAEMKVHIDEYRINEDQSIDILNDIDLTNRGLEELPKFVKFNKIYGGFYAGGNNWQSLKGFPNEIKQPL